MKKAFLFACGTGLGLAEILKLRWTNVKNGILVSNRVNSYFVNPLVYLKGAEIDNLKAMCRVTDSAMNWKTALYENKFSAKPFEIFSHMNEAIIWATDSLFIIE